MHSFTLKKPKAGKKNAPKLLILSTNLELSNSRTPELTSKQTTNTLIWLSSILRKLASDTTLANTSKTSGLSSATRLALLPKALSEQETIKHSSTRSQSSTSHRVSSHQLPMQNGDSSGRSVTDLKKFRMISLKLTQRTSHSGSSKWTSGATRWSIQPWLLLKWQQLAWALTKTSSLQKCTKALTFWVQLLLMWLNMTSAQHLLPSIMTSISLPFMANQDTQASTSGPETGNDSQCQSHQVVFCYRQV